MSYKYVSGKVEFGLNQDVRLTKFEYNPNGGRDESAQDCLDVTVQVAGREFRKRWYEVEKVYFKGNEISEKDPNFEKEKKKLEKDLSETVISIVEAIVPATVVKEHLGKPTSSFKEFIQNLEEAVKSNPDWDNKPLDVFLPYQWIPSKNNTRTFEEIPKSIKHGSFLVEHVPGDFAPIETDKGLSYYDSNLEIYHPFKRTGWFMSSNFAIPVSLEDNPQSSEIEGVSEANTWQKSI